jgi:hypothetical protein
LEKFLDTYDLPKLNQKDVKKLTGSITSNEIDAVIKSLLSKKSPGPDGCFFKEFQNSQTLS